MDAGVSAASTKDVVSFAEAAVAIVGSQNVRAATAADVVSGVQPQFVVAPASETELAQVLKLANDNGIAVIPCGGGSKLSWGNPPNRADIVLSTSRLNAVVEHAHSDLTVTAEAGCTIKHLGEALAQYNQRLAIDALWPSRATIGGILSTNDSGALRLRFGSLRDLVIGVTIALPDGTLAKSGGKVVKNVAGYDLPKLVTGALGTLGIITQATFRLHPAPKESRTTSCLARDSRDAQRLSLMIQDSNLAHSALQIRFVDGMQPQLDVKFEATEAGCSAQIGQLKKLLEPAAIIDSGPAVWKARQELYSESTAHLAEIGRSDVAPLHGRDGAAVSALAKISVLPTQIADAYDAIATLAAANRAHFSAVFYAFGVGTIYVASAPDDLAATLKQLRAQLETIGGSLVVAHRPAAIATLDAWGNAGDALPVMRVVKKQFDPKSTLNPGRFVGGI